MNRAIVRDRYKATTKRTQRIKKILLHVLQHLKASQTEVHATLIGDDQMKALNQTYRKKRKTTDVLAFEANEDFGKFQFVGDIVISPTQASIQAKNQGHRVKDELAILSIHGLLHLFGYDHMSIEDEKVMFALQKKLYEQTKHFT